MTLLELVIATMILFIAITAVFGLMSVSTNMTMTSKQESIVTNAASGYIEQARALPYNSLGVLGASVPGSLTVVTTMTVAGFEVTITPTVEFVDDPAITGNEDYKRLTIVVSAGARGRSPLGRTYQTIVRRPDEIQGGATPPPVIEFDSVDAPAKSQVIYGDSVIVKANGSSSLATLSRVSFFCEVPVLRGSGGGVGTGNTAEWFDLNAQSGSWTFYWNTRAINPDTGQPWFRDGTRSLKIEVYDTLNQKSYRVRQVMIDNYPPGPPAYNPLYYGPNSTGTSSYLYWGAAPDGTENANHYVVHIWKETSLGGGGGPGGGWEDLGDTENPSPAANPSSTGYNFSAVRFPSYVPFGRFWTRLSPHSYRHLYKTDAGGAEILYDQTVPFVTRPTGLGNTTNTKVDAGSERTWTTKNIVSLVSPSFANSGVTYTLYRSLASDMSTATVVGTQTLMSGSCNFTDTYTTTGPKNSVLPTSYYYQVKADFTPTGWFPPGYTGTTALFTWSGVYGPSSMVEGASPMNVVGWTSKIDF